MCCLCAPLLMCLLIAFIKIYEDGFLTLFMQLEIYNLQKQTEFNFQKHQIPKTALFYIVFKNICNLNFSETTLDKSSFFPIPNRHDFVLKLIFEQKLNFLGHANRFIVFLGFKSIRANLSMHSLGLDQSDYKILEILITPRTFVTHNSIWLKYFKALYNKISKCWGMKRRFHMIIQQCDQKIDSVLSSGYCANKVIQIFQKVMVYYSQTCIQQFKILNQNHCAKDLIDSNGFFASRYRQWQQTNIIFSVSYIYWF